MISDFNNIFLWQKLEDFNEKRMFQKFQLIQIFRLQVMHDFVDIAPYTTVLNKFSDIKILGKLLLFHPEMISAQFLKRNVFLRGELQRDVKILILIFLRTRSTWNQGVFFVRSEFFGRFCALYVPLIIIIIIIIIPLKSLWVTTCFDRSHCNLW